MQLRPYQQQLKADIYSEWQRGAQTVLAVLPTGGGKSAISASVVNDHQGAACVMAHRAELVSQLSLALAREHVRHRVIGPPALAKLCVAAHMDALRTTYYDPNARVGVASVQSIESYKDHAGWFNQVSLVVHDECFPAGTLVDGRPIETIAVGDMITAFDETTESLRQKKVTRLFKNVKPKQMVCIKIGHHDIQSTSNHPFFTRRGWVVAGELTHDDQVLALQCDDRKPEESPTGSIGENGENILLTNVRLGLSISAWIEAAKRNTRDTLHSLRSGKCREWFSLNSISKKGRLLLQRCVHIGASVGGCNGDCDEDQQKICVGSDDHKQPNAKFGKSGESGCYSACNEPPAKSAWRQRATPDSSGVRARFNILWTWVSAATRSANQRLRGFVGSAGDTLQNRLRKSCAKDCDRGGWLKSQQFGAQDPGCQKGQVLAWARVDSVSIQERDDTDATDGSSNDGYVFNIEVEDLHTYLVHGIVVHNCHHLLRENQFGKAVAKFPNAKLLGVTATPLRADGKGLGRKSDGLFDAMVEGPAMRELIEAGFLSKYRVFAPPSNLNRSEIPVTASGDFSAKVLHDVTKRSTVLGDIVQHYIKHASGKLGLTFADSIDNATDIALRFKAAGVNAEVLTGKTEGWLRASILKKFAAREVMQIVSVALIDEGFDCPAVEVVSDGAATESYGRFAQRFGRGLRVLEGKSHMLYFDHVGNVLRHGLPDAPREWSLDRRERKSSKKVDDSIPLRTCSECTGAYKAFYKACPYCGHQHVPAGRSAPEQVDGDLIEMVGTPWIAETAKEVERIDGPCHAPGGMPAIAVRGLQNAHYERQVAQNHLRNTMATWAGWKASLGHDDSESYKLFYFRYGIDAMTAKTLGRGEAQALAALIQTELDKNGVIPK